MKQIIAISGGGFSSDTDSRAIDRYILKQCSKPRPKICFVPTASGDTDQYVLKFYEAFLPLECQPSALCLFRLPTADLESFVLEKDIIYVGGGNTRNLMVLWREWGLDNIFRKAYEAGVILAGISAGANCWFEQCTTDSVPGQIRALTCLGILPGSISPHYDSEPARRPAMQRMVQSGELLPGYGLDDPASLHFIDGQLAHALRSTPNGIAYRVSLENGQVVETTLEMKAIE
jgi:dipeptidase E